MAKFDRANFDLPALRRSNQIVALRNGDQWAYPSFQFEAGTAIVRQPVLKLLAAIGSSIDHWLIVGWLALPHPRFDNRRAIDLLDRHIDQVCALMRAGIGLDDG